MDDNDLEVLWRGKESTLTLRAGQGEEGDEVWGYVGKKHALTMVLGDDGEWTESFCHDDLEYEEEDLADALEDLDGGGGGDEDDDEDSEEDDEDSDDEDDDDDLEEDDDLDGDLDEDDDEDSDDDDDDDAADDKDAS